MKWADLYIKELSLNNISTDIAKRVNGWIESAIISEKHYYVKSFTYDHIRRQYFQGVDPKKSEESGDRVLLCGGANTKLKDIFIIPWDQFFINIKSGEPINTYKPPREYYQYKFYFRDRGNNWLMYVQPIKNTNIFDITQYRFDIKSSIDVINLNVIIKDKQWP